MIILEKNFSLPFPEKNRKIQIGALITDVEACDWAGKLKTFLEGNGYSVEMDCRSLFTPPIRGTVLVPDATSGPQIKVGTNE